VVGAFKGARCRSALSLVYQPRQVVVYRLASKDSRVLRALQADARVLAVLSENVRL
jgi:hypothetical protein